MRAGRSDERDRNPVFRAGVGGKLGPDLADQIGTDAASPTRLMTLYTAWANAQPPTADISPEAFAKYLDGLAKAAA